MNYETTQDFWDIFQKLPPSVRKQAQKIYRLWIENPQHPSLHFKKVNESQPFLYSIRINNKFRALAVQHNDTFVWFWIGTHTAYDRLIESYQ